VTPARPQTAPHDYRVIFERQPAPTVVGGQAVNLWAINYLMHVVPKETLVSKDLDVVASKEALANLKAIPRLVISTSANSELDGLAPRRLAQRHA